LVAPSLTTAIAVAVAGGPSIHLWSSNFNWYASLPLALE
jgi:hypothetical protein